MSFSFGSHFELSHETLTELEDFRFSHEITNAPVNVLTKHIAQDIFAPACRVLVGADGGETDQACSIDVSRISSLPTSTRLGDFEQMPVQRCTAQDGPGYVWLWFPAPKRSTVQRQDGDTYDGADYLKGATLSLYAQRLGFEYALIHDDVRVYFHVDESNSQCIALSEDERCVGARFHYLNPFNAGKFDCDSFAEDRWFVSFRNESKLVVDEHK